MERNSPGLESIISSQQKQLTRYENRMKDLVAAYKSLFKEKEALESTVAALTTSTSIKQPAIDIHQKPNEQQQSYATISSIIVPDETDLKMQITTVMNALATLSAEKSKMEASFQADKRQLRKELLAKDAIIKELQEHQILARQEYNLNMEKCKSKLICERHDREKETNDHMVMVRELQKLLADERHLNETLEMQLNDLKAHFARRDLMDVGSSGNVSTTITDQRVRELTSELEQIRAKINQTEISGKNKEILQTSPIDQKSDTVLRHLQNEIVSLKHQHAIAIRQEQKRAAQAEEQYRKLAVVHEDRVANLESRLAELSTTVGTYDRMRQLDQENIFNLKEKIAQFEMNGTYCTSSTMATTIADMPIKVATNVTEKPLDIDELINEIVHLKKILLVENAKQQIPKDLSQIFAPVSGAGVLGTGPDHTECCERIENLQRDYEAYRSTYTANNNIIETQKNHITNLQSKVQVLNRNIDEQEQELKNKSTEYLQEIRGERQKWKELIATMEMDFRGKCAELEQQLQKQRERSLKLLEEKETEIKFLKSNGIDVIASGVGCVASSGRKLLFDAGNHSVDVDKSTDNNDIIPGKTHQFNVMINPSTSGSSYDSVGNSRNSAINSQSSAANSAEYHMLHYVHELARKEVEITNLRKAKHTAESALRQALQDKVTAQEELHDKIIALEENVDRLKRCQSREGANLEYLKNVILSFLITNDADSKRHMINAIGAVLKFSNSESKTIAMSLNKYR